MLYLQTEFIEIMPEKFLFNTRFEEKEKPKKPVEPTFSKAQLEDARQEGYAQGFSEGTAKATAETEERLNNSIQANLATLMQAFAAEWTALSSQQEDEVAELSERSYEVIATSVKKLFPYVEERYGLKEIEEIIAQTAELLRLKAALTIEVHPDMEEPFKDILQQHHVPQTESLVITPNASLGLSDFSVHWGQEGGLNRNAQQAFDTLDALLSPNTAPSGANKPEPEPVSEPKPDSENEGQNDGEETTPSPDETPSIEPTEETEKSETPKEGDASNG